MVPKKRRLCLNAGVKINARACELRLANPWKIASTKGSGTHRTVIVELAKGEKAMRAVHAAFLG